MVDVPSDQTKCHFGLDGWSERPYQVYDKASTLFILLVLESGGWGSTTLRETVKIIFINFMCIDKLVEIVSTNLLIHMKIISTNIFIHMKLYLQNHKI